MTARVAVGVLALQGDVPEHGRALEAVGAHWTRVRRPEELDGLDGLVLPGGESSTIDKLLRRYELMEPLRERIRAGLPVYGACAGMVLLADRLIDGIDGQQTIGGLDVTVRRNAFGRQMDSFEEDLNAPAFGTADGGPSLRAVFIRAPWVEQAGADVEVVATVRTGAAAGKIVAVRQGALMATAFHPEISSDVRVHRAFVDMVRAHLCSKLIER